MFIYFFSYEVYNTPVTSTFAVQGKVSLCYDAGSCTDVNMNYELGYEVCTPPPSATYMPGSEFYYEGI
jgi:hypothetical protein